MKIRRAWSLLCFILLPALLLAAPKESSMMPYDSPADPFEIKSAKIVMDISPDNHRVYIFDDFGRTESQEDVFYADAAHKRTAGHYLRITANNVTTLIDLQTKTGRRAETPPGMSMDNGGLSITRVSLYSTFSQMKYQKLASETIMGRLCEVYLVDDPNWGYKSTFWLWKKIPLKADVNGVEMTVTDVQENPALPKSTFETPSGIVFPK